MIKKISSLFISIIIITNPLLYADNVVKKDCQIISKEDYFPVGDERGRTVMTKTELVQDCNLTIEADGSCKKWETKKSQYNIKASDYNTYRSNNHAGAIGQLFAIIGAYDQLSHLWSGWKGYCEIGTKIDFSWAKDPSFWASLVMSTVVEGSQEGGFLDGTSVGDAVSNMGNAGNALAVKAGIKVGENFGTCLIANGVDLGKDLYQYFAEDDTLKCDPVDEFCGDVEAQTSEKDIITISETQYNDLLSEHPEVSKYVIILPDDDPNDGILSIRLKNLNEIDDMKEKTGKELEDAKNKLKNMQLKISLAITGIKMASCIMTDGSMGAGGDYGQTATNDGRFSVKNGIGMAINSIPADWLGPYGAIIKAGLSVLLNFINSFKDIDTCHNEKDAQNEGSRHAKTQETLPYNLCILTKKTCAQKEFFGGGCGLHAFHYCCYDQELTKVLIAQIKAQLGRDWTHCTGITLDDLKYVSFRQCTDNDKKQGFDGTKVVLKYNADGDLIEPAGWTDANWLKSYQHKAKCIDLTEFKEYLSKTFNEDIDFSDFDAIFQDMGGQIEPIPQ